jgi:hypothetical protein
MKPNERSQNIGLAGNAILFSMLYYILHPKHYNANLREVSVQPTSANKEGVSNPGGAAGCYKYAKGQIRMILGRFALGRTRIFETNESDSPKRKPI